MPDFKEYQKYVPGLLFLIFLCLFLWQLYCYFYPDLELQPASDFSDTPVQPQIALDSALFHTAIFGNWMAEDSVKTSTLDIELVGILYSTIEKNSQVLIRLSSGREKIYHTGDKLPGGAVIKRIEKERALVLYKGALESLNLPKDELQLDEPAKPLLKD